MADAKIRDDVARIHGLVREPAARALVSDPNAAIDAACVLLEPGTIVRLLSVPPSGLHPEAPPGRLRNAFRRAEMNNGCQL